MTEECETGGSTEHATAIIVAETGILFVGASGSGKSSTAFACLDAAISRGWNAALVADDRTYLTQQAGRCIASCPEPISGLIELRGAGIARLRCHSRAVIHLVVAPGAPSDAARLPAENETITCKNVKLPLLRLWRNGDADPLSTLCALRPDCFLLPERFA